jgi:general secretion pathway protein D
MRKWQVVVALAAGLTGCQSWPPDREPSMGIGEPAPPAEPRGSVVIMPPAEALASKAVSPVIERGTGTFVDRTPAHPTAIMSRNARGDVSLNVVDADVREVVRIVLGDGLGADYVIDPTVQGSITAQTSQPVPADDLVPILDAVLRANSAALVRAGDLYKVVPIEQAMTSGPTPTILPLPEAGTPGFGIRVVPVRYVSATQVATLLEPFAPLGGSIQTDLDRNLLLLAGSPDELETLGELVATFDVDWLAGMSFGLFPLESVDATPLVAELKEVFGGPEGGPLAGVVRFVPLDRLSAILVITSQPEYLSRAQVWIERLDRDSESEEEQIFVYPIQNGRAADLASVLSEIFDIRAATVGPSDLLAPGLQPVQITSSTFEPGQSEAEPAYQPPPQSIPSAPSRIERRRLLAAGEGPLGGNVRVIADQTTNSLVIRATPRDYRKIQGALEHLDILPLQVLIEATIAEVSLDGDLRYGVEWFLTSGDASFTFSRLSSGLVEGAFPGFSALFANGDVRAVLNALERVTDLNVISSPHLLVLDNQTARLLVGDQVPIVTQTAVSVTNPDAPIVNSIEQRDTGVILSVTPRVNASGLVIMEIEEETSDVVETTTSDIDSPTIRQRKVGTTVAVQSGQTIVLAGLIQDDVKRTEFGIPVLHRLPIIGPLFGVKNNLNVRTELLVVITPRVIGTPNQARDVTEELRQRLRRLAPLGAKIR